MSEQQQQQQPTAEQLFNAQVLSLLSQEEFEFVRNDHVSDPMSDLRDITGRIRRLQASVVKNVLRSPAPTSGDNMETDEIVIPSVPSPSVNDKTLKLLGPTRAMKQRASNLHSKLGRLAAKLVALGRPTP